MPSKNSNSIIIVVAFLVLIVYIYDGSLFLSKASSSTQADRPQTKVIVSDPKTSSSSPQKKDTRVKPFDVPVDLAPLPNHPADFYTKYDQYMRLLDETVNDEALDRVINENKDYRSQYPFPHGKSEGLFPQSVLDAVNVEIPDDPVLDDAGCVKGSQFCFLSKKKQNRKNAFENETAFGPATLAVFRKLKSPKFTRFLEKLTGIEGLIPDPAYRGSGIHQTLPGGHLGIHADFNLYTLYGNIHRRVNTFVFLNDDWKSEYGGALELWTKDLKSCGAKYLPLMNRFVVFSSTDFSYHGQPHPLTAPPGRSRRSLALYYYTRSRPTNECVNDDCYDLHTTLFKSTFCNDCEEQVCRNISSNHYAR